MKRSVLMSFSVVAVLGLATPVLAQTPQSTSGSGPTIAPAPANDPKAELEARLQQRKATQKTQLSEAQTRNLQEKCTQAQPKIEAVGTKFTEMNTPLQTAFQSRSAQLQKVLFYGQDEKIDVVGVTKTSTEYNQKNQAYVAAGATFTTSINDLKLIDCKADPLAFKATLDSSRAELKTVQTMRDELMTYSKGPLLDAVKNIKTTTEQN